MATILELGSKKTMNTWYNTFKKMSEDLKKNAITFDEVNDWVNGIYHYDFKESKAVGSLMDLQRGLSITTDRKIVEDFTKKIIKELDDVQKDLADKLGKRIIKKLDDLKKIQENRKLQLTELEKKKNEKEVQLDKKLKTKHTKLITETKKRNKELDVLITQLDKVKDKSNITAPQLKQITDFLDMKKSIDKEVEELSGVKTYGGMNPLESKKFIEDFLSDQRAHQKNKSTRQIVGESKFNVSKMFYGVGQEWGKKASRVLGKKLGKLEPFHENLIKEYESKYATELEEDGSLSEEEQEKELMAFEKNLRKNFSKAIRSKDILTETDTDKIKDMSMSGKSKASEKKPPEKPTKTAKNYYKGGTLDNDVNIVGEKGIEVIKGKDVYTPDGDKTNTGKWADTLKSMLGINRKGNDPLLMHTIALRTDVLDIKKLIGSKFKYDTERDEDLDSLREDKVDKKEVLPKGEISEIIEKDKSKFGLILGGLAMALLPLAGIAAALASLAITLPKLYDLYKDHQQVKKSAEEVEQFTKETWKNKGIDISNGDDPILEDAKRIGGVQSLGKFGEYSLVLNDAKLLLDKKMKYQMENPDKAIELFEKDLEEYYNKKDISTINPFTRGSRTGFESIIEKMEKQLQEKQIIDALSSPGNILGMKPQGFAMGGDWKVSGENGIEFENVSSNGRSGRVLSPLNKSVEHRQSLKDVLKESFKELNGTVQSFNPTEFKNITLQLYKDTIAVFEKNIAKNNQTKENGRIAMINNNIMGNRNQEVVVKEKHIPVSEDFIRIK